MRKNILFRILFLILFTFVSVTEAQDTETPQIFVSGDWEYTRNDTGITLSKYQGSGTDIFIPGTLDGVEVTKIGDDLFKNNMDLERAVFDDDLTFIGNNMFSGCTSLKEVHLPANLKSIPTGAFRYCKDLEEIRIPMSVTSIGYYSFADCIKLKEVNLLSVTSVGESAFENCISLENILTSNKLTTVNGHAFYLTPWLETQTDEFVFTGKGVLLRYNGNAAEVKVPDGTTSISSAFEENYIIESVSLPDTVKTIGQYAFREAINLRSINIPPFVTAINSNAFEGCRNLTEIVIPQSVKTISPSAFRYCEKISKAAVPSGVTSLGSLLFGDCTALTDVIVPDSVTSINNTAFKNSPNVRLQVAYGSFAEKFAQENGIQFAYTHQITDEYIYGPGENGVEIIRYTGSHIDVEIPAEINGNRVTSIGSAAFQNNNFVRRVVVPMTVTTIGDWAFSYMDSLEYIKLSANLTALGANAFSGTEALTDIRLPEKLEYIGEKPFDREAQTTLCASEGSAPSQILTDMGYEVKSLNHCNEDAELTALRAELNRLGVLYSACDCSQCPPEGSTAAPSGVTVIYPSVASDISIIRIPDDLSEITPDLLANAGHNLILVIPNTVSSIDPQILEEHDITIAAEEGSYAEQFARENDVRFTSRVSVYLGL